MGQPLAVVDTLPHAELLLHAAFSQYQADKMNKEIQQARDRA